MKQFRSLRLKQSYLDACDYFGRQPLRFPPARRMEPILFILLPLNLAIFTFFTCQRPLSECTIMYTTNVAGFPMRLFDIQNPKPLVSLRAACCCAVQVVQLGLMRRRKHPLFQLSLFPLHQPFYVSDFVKTWLHKCVQRIGLERVVSSWLLSGRL